MKKVIPATNDSIMAMLQDRRVVESDIFTNGEKVDGYKCISYEKNKEPICVVSDTYGVLQHDEIIERTFNDLSKAGVNYEVKSVTFNDSYKRNTMTTTITLPDLIMNVDGSPIAGTIYIDNGTDGLTSFTREFGFYRFVCQNGLRVPQELMISEKLKHRKNLAIMDIYEGIESIRKYMPTFGSILERAQKIKINDELSAKLQHQLHIAPRVFENIMSGSYSEKYKNMVPEQVNMDTLWGFYQVMTNYLTHEVAPRNIKTAQNTNERLYNFLQNAA